MCDEVVSSTQRVGDWGILLCHVDGAEGGEESRCEGEEYNSGLEALAEASCCEFAQMLASLLINPDSLKSKFNFSSLRLVMRFVIEILQHLAGSL